MNKRIIMTLIGVALCFVMTGCGDSVYDKHEDNCTSIESIEGVCFDVPTDIISNATLVSNTDGIVKKDESYLYRTDTEWSFYNMENMVITVKKGTSFNVEEIGDFYDCLPNSPINTTWLEKNSKKDEVIHVNKDSVSKYYSTVKGETAVTNELYENFAGKMAILYYNGEEYSIFAGIKGDKYSDVVNDSYKPYVEHIVKSFRIKKEIEEVPVEVIEPVKEIPSASVDVPEVIGTPTPTPTPTPIAQVNEEELKDIPLFKENERVETGLYFKMNEWAEISALGKNGDKYTGNVYVKRIMTGNEATTFLDSVLKDVPKVDAGCSWNVVEYATTMDTDEVYIDVSILGENRKNLKFRGITYTQRGYDIFTEKAIRRNVAGRLYCYYAVPNGCNQYTLGFGADSESKKYIIIN